MADILWTDVVDVQSNLSTVSAGAQAMFLGYVNNELEASVFGGDTAFRYKLARVFLAAHFGELTRRVGAGGAVASESYGTSSVSISYAMTDDALMSTTWGSAFKEFLDMSTVRIGLTTGPSCR